MLQFNRTVPTPPIGFSSVMFANGTRHVEERPAIRELRLRGVKIGSLLVVLMLAFAATVAPAVRTALFVANDRVAAIARFSPVRKSDGVGERPCASTTMDIVRQLVAAQLLVERHAHRRGAFGPSGKWFR
jgi:hypothetical protein